jgi:hypothetical protein
MWAGPAGIQGSPLSLGLVVADSAADKAYNAPTSPAIKPEIDTA